MVGNRSISVDDGDDERLEEDDDAVGCLLIVVEGLNARDFFGKMQDNRVKQRNAINLIMVVTQEQEI